MGFASTYCIGKGSVVDINHISPPYYLLLLTIFFVFAIPFCRGQQVSISSLDTFNSEVHSGEEFADGIQAIRKKITNSKRYEDIRNLDQYVNNIEKYSFEKKFDIRVAYTRHAKAYYKYLSDLFSAEHYYLKAHQILSQEELLRDEWVWHIENTLAIINNQLGNTDESLFFYELAQSAMELQGDKNLCRLLGNKGILLESQHKFDEARIIFNKGIQIAKEIDNTQGEGIIRLNLANLNIKERRFEKAQFQLDSLKSILKDSRFKAQYYHVYLGLLASIEYEQGRYSNSIDILSEQLVQMDSFYASPFRREYSKVYEQLASVYTRSKLFKESRASIKKGLGWLVQGNTEIFIDKEKFYAENTFMELYDELGKLYAIKYDESGERKFLDSALLAYDYALLVNDLIVADYNTTDAKYWVAYTNKESTTGLFEVLHKYTVNNIPFNRERILRYLQKTKSYLYDESLASLIAFRHLSQEEKSKYIDLKMNLIKIQNESLLTTSSKLKINLDVSRQIDSLLKNLQYPEMDTRNQFIEYVVAKDYVYAIDNFNGELNISRPCQSAILKDEQKQLLSLITSEASITEVKQIANNIYRLLFNNYEYLPEAFVIVPDSYMSHIPFDALVDDHGSWLIENHHISNMLSLASIDKIHPSFNKILCLQPDYGPERQQIAHNRSDIYPLKYANQEVNAIAANYENITVIESITIEEFPSALMNYDVLHYAGHARSGELSGRLILDVNENSLYGTDISQFPNELHLAVLSACETGFGEIKFGEGSMNLARSFLSAGTSNVINSLWTVNDQSTAQLMKNFYLQLRSSNRPNVALRQAKTDLLFSTEQEVHPYHWAGFILTTNEVVVEPKYHITYLILIGIVTSAFLLIIYLKSRS